MNKKIIIISIIFILCISCLLSVPLTSSTQVFRAIKYDSEVPTSFVFTIEPTNVVKQSEVGPASHKSTIWDLDNDIINMKQTESQKLFDFTFTANSYGLITLKFTTSSLRKEDEPTKTIDFDLDVEINPSSMKYYMFKQEKNGKWKQSEQLSLTIDSISSNPISLNKQTAKDGDKDTYRYGSGKSYINITQPVVYDVIEGVSVNNNSNKLVGHLNSNSNQPLILRYQLKIIDNGAEYALNDSCTRKGSVYIKLNIPSNVAYGQYITQLYVELEVN